MTTTGGGPVAAPAVEPVPEPRGSVGSPVSARGDSAGLWQRLRRDRSATGAALLLAFILLSCLAAPLYARHVAMTDPFRSNLDGEVLIDGELRPVMEPSTEGLGLGVTPLGPTWRWGPFFLGADMQGRDVAARLLYGGLNSLLIAGIATLLTLVIATIIGLAAGFVGGILDTVLARLLDVLWAFPIYLLAISLSIVLINQGLKIGPIELRAGSIWLPALIIGIVYVPYVARPLRGQVLSLKESEFVTAAIGLGAPTSRILLREILPNLTTTLTVMTPLLMALDLLTESALSFLSIGVQPPRSSWGTIIQDGQSLLYNRPWVALAPGIAVATTVLALNVLGDAVRDALDPRTKIKLRTA